jgi:hypothetical protein
MFNYFFYVNRAVYEIKWNNTVEADWPQMIVVRHVCFDAG